MFEVTAFTQTVIADSSQLSDLTDCLQDVPYPLPSNGDSNTPTYMNTSNLNIEDHFCNISYVQQTSETFYNLNHTYSSSTRKMHDSNTQSSVNASNFNCTIQDYFCNHSNFQQTSDTYYNLNHTYSSSTQKMYDSNTQLCVNASNFNSTFEDHSCNHYDFQRYSNKRCNLNHTYSSQMPAKKTNIFQRLLYLMISVITTRCL